MSHGSSTFGIGRQRKISLTYFLSGYINKRKSNKRIVLLQHPNLKFWLQMPFYNCAFFHNIVTAPLYNLPSTWNQQMQQKMMPSRTPVKTLWMAVTLGGLLQKRDATALR